ncbi:fimbrial protein [Klebsiella aerogenes]|uniref:fimbrial protein n=1 Tax=Klebsiella aerogenes TaxID=548 RepID=UPI00254CEDF5|nr:fimbrial protein [Klebsiella aerogenes]MDK7100079.1 fimbrial protein [Klebsiella aerogenes]MDK7645550.1 fimbrial protein [Klebsiella aerogenes]MDK7850451.1 fimbrial protein [Klebsiella aerogenes]MDK8313040.1 fimbrial protein [Klebsiella aerogenes]
MTSYIKFFSFTMKNVLCKHVVFILCITCSFHSISAEQNIHLFGTLVAEPCIIPPGEEEVELDFGNIIDKYLYTNTRTPGYDFSIHLTECDLSVSNAVSISFEGVESLSLPGLLSIDSGSSASGIAIGIETMEGKQVLINHDKTSFALQEGESNIDLKAYIQGEPDALINMNVAPGFFYATAIFKLVYE